MKNKIISPARQRSGYARKRFRGIREKSDARMMFFGKVFIPAVEVSEGAGESPMVSTLELVTQATYSPEALALSEKCTAFIAQANPPALASTE